MIKDYYRIEWTKMLPTEIIATEAEYIPYFSTRIVRLINTSDTRYIKSRNLKQMYLLDLRWQQKTMIK